MEFGTNVLGPILAIQEALKYFGTRALAHELGSRNIRVNSIAPGLTETEAFTASKALSAEVEEQRVTNTPLGRLGQPEDIAKLAVFLASDDFLDHRRNNQGIRRVCYNAAGNPDKDKSLRDTGAFVLLLYPGYKLPIN